jgi:hypothetical protein
MSGMGSRVSPPVQAVQVRSDRSLRRPEMEISLSGGDAIIENALCGA